MEYSGVEPESDINGDEFKGVPSPSINRYKRKPYGTFLLVHQRYRHACQQTLQTQCANG